MCQSTLQVLLPHYKFIDLSEALILFYLYRFLDLCISLRKDQHEQSPIDKKSFSDVLRIVQYRKTLQF